MKVARKRGRGLVCLFFVALFLFSACNAHLLFDPLRRVCRGENTLSEAARQTRAAYVGGISFKSAFVDLNGAYARLTGRHVYHGVSVLKNGMLDRDGVAAIDTGELAQALVRFSDALAARGISFLFVQIPSKSDLAGELACDGVENAANLNADALCKTLSARNVELLDLRSQLAATAAEVEHCFYRTDHHWNTDGAFCAFKEVLSRIAAMLTTRTVDVSWGSAERWERQIYPDWLLGSHGKRVGRFFGGVDDLVLYTPKERIETTLALPHKEIFKSGDFSEVLLCKEYLDAPDYHGDDAYCVYLGGNYPLVVHQTVGIEKGAHVLLIKDSFSLPLEAMLSTALSRLDAIDPRYFGEETVLEYAERTHPDLVVVAINPSVFSDGAYLDFGA